MSALPPKADIAWPGRHVRFVPKADIRLFRLYVDLLLDKTGRVKAKIHGRGNRVLSDSRAPHLRQRHGFDLGANAASHCVMAEIVVRLFYSSAARLEYSGGTRRCCIHGLSTGQKLRDRGHPG